MTESLFRQEAVEATKNKLIGAVALYTPPYRWLMIGLASALTCCVVIVFITGTYTKRESVQGELVPDRGVLSLAPPFAGTVINLSVHEGEIVEKGAPLIVISSEVGIESGGTRKIIADQLKLQSDRLVTDMEGQLLLGEEETRGFRLRALMFGKQLKELRAQNIQRTRQGEISIQQLDKIKLMREQGYASNQQVEQQEALVLEAQTRLQDIARQRLDIEQQLSQVHQQIREHPIRLRNLQHDTQRQLAELEQTRAENESRREVVLRAPETSTIGALMIKPGQIVSGGQTVVSLLPQGTVLEARLMVPSRAIGFIKAGQRVVLRYQAYPYQKFGQRYGQIIEISRVALSPQDVVNMTGKTGVQEQHYRVSVKLDQQSMNVYGHDEALRPGMALEADILIDNRRLIEWVLEPLYALGRRAAF